jgi:cellulose synthase/poly-beta-1,6-N-acetylglucosamine synthase-like glycosyltransferase
MPRLSVVIPTLGRPILIQTLDSLLRCQGFSSIEVIVAGMIREPTVAARVQTVVAQHPNVRHLPVSFPVGDSSEKKNAGFRAARADLVAFLDDDVVVAPDWPDRILAPFADPATAVVSGPSLVPPDVGLVARLAGLALASPAAGYVAWRYRADHPEAIPIKWSKIIGCNMAYRREALDGVGGFDPGFWPGEEMIASFRTEQGGHRLMFHPAAWVYHYPRQSLARFWKQIYGYGATRIRLFRGGVEIECSTMVPALWVASLLVLGAGGLLWRPLWWLLALDVALYAAMSLAVTLMMVASTKQARDLLLFFVIPVMHLSYGIGSWVEFARPNKDLSEPAVR